VALPEQPRDECLHAVGDAEQVHPDHPLPILDGRRLDIAAVADTGVIVQDVEAAVSSEHHLGELLEIVGPRDVDSVNGCAAADLGRDGGGRIGVDISDVHLFTVSCQQPCRGPPDAGPGAGDHRDLARQIDVFRHGDPPRRRPGFTGPEWTSKKHAIISPGKLESSVGAAHRASTVVFARAQKAAVKVLDTFDC
jgi:hypothetical protein